MDSSSKMQYTSADVAIAELAVRLVQQITTQVRTGLEANRSARQQSAGQTRLLTAKQAGVYIGRSEQAIRHMIHQRDIRDIPVVRNGRCVRIDRTDLDRWVENNKC